MNVSCPECQSVFRVDPARVPGPGIRARCSVCGGIIPITATRSWTDDFATSHDAASLTASPRGAARPSSAGSTRSPETAGVSSASRASSTPSSSAAFGSTQGPPVAPPRPVTPTRVPPVSPPRKPTPTSAPAVPPSSASLPAPSAHSVAMPHASETHQQVPNPAPRQMPPQTGGASQPAAPRMPDVSIGAPTSRPPAPPRLSSPTAPQHSSASSIHDAGAIGKALDTSGGQSPAGAAPPSARSPVDAAPGSKPINPFLANDPNQKAKRLARALVSDMVAYHPQKRDEGVRAGTLKQLFREEIKKSYEEYVEQIGKEFAESTSHFQDALNDVLAGGKKVF